MTSSVKHHKVVATADDGTSDVGTNEWNEPHDLVGLSTQGTSFPGSPSNGDRVFRTDLGLECYYDSASGFWLTTQQFEAGGSTVGTALSGLASTSAVVSRIAVRNDFAMYLTQFCASTFINGSSSGTAFWTVGLEFYTAGNTTSNITSFSTGTTPDTGSNWTSHVVNINAALDATARELVVSMTKTSTPGAIFWGTSLYYRLIVT